MNTKKERSKMLIAALGVFSLFALVAGFAGRSLAQKNQAQKQAVDANGAPLYKVDPFWPKPLPNRWSMQQVTGLSIEAKNDHVWFLNRAQAADGDEIGGDGNPPKILCCVKGPEAVELDPEGNVVTAWGSAQTIPEWPKALQTIIADRDGNIWIGGTNPQDSVLKFTREGKLLWDFGHRPPKDAPTKEDNQTTDYLTSKGRFYLDEDKREMYMVNQKRLLVFDMDSGAFKRGWGGHGIPLSEISNDPIPPYVWTGAAPPEEKQFVPDLHFVLVSKDRLVYVGERGQDRIEVFTPEGKFVKEFYVAPNTPARGPDCGGLPPKTQAPPCGTTYKMVFSNDPGQKFLFVADGTNDVVWILDRESGKTLGNFGGNGKYAGQFHWINAIGMDSKGNIFTGEVEEAKRIQKFVPVMAAAK